MQIYQNNSLFADFDNEIKSGKSNLSDILDIEDSSAAKQKGPTNNFSFGSFSSIVTKKRADGVTCQTIVNYTFPCQSD